MARYQAILTYDGTGFAGSQRQARSRTVQGELEKALRRLGWKGRAVALAGRTDSGVHAAGQVAAFDLDWRHGTADLLAALNAGLPSDLAVRDLRPAPAGFNPRRDACARTYRYRLFCDPLRDPLRERYAWRVWPPVDAEALNATAALLPGTRDFAAFGSPPGRKGGTVRTVFAAAWQARGEEWQFVIRADAFLYRMVRRLVAVQVMVAQARLDRSAVEQALETGRSLPAGLAPACGLTLMEVEYPRETADEQSN